jgi:Mrp family chromosome partitioning ATPase
MRELLKELSQVADLIVIDSPPALLLADTAGLARAVDGVLIVAWAGTTRRQDLKNAARSLRQVGANPIGVVLNAVPTARESYYRYYDTAGEKSGQKRTRWFRQLGNRLTPSRRKRRATRTST